MVLPRIKGSIQNTSTTSRPSNPMSSCIPGHKVIFYALLALVLLSGCASPRHQSRMMEATAYCNCGQCCNWERGSWSHLKLDFWNKYVSTGAQAGSSYSGNTAAGTAPNEPEPGLFSLDSAARPWRIPQRLLPWNMLPSDGTIAADTKYYPFGTRMNVPGYGWGIVEDRGGAIKGPDRIDLYFDSHSDALEWGRRKVRVVIEYPH